MAKIQAKSEGDNNNVLVGQDGNANKMWQGADQCKFLSLNDKIFINNISIHTPSLSSLPLLSFNDSEILH